MRSKYALFVVAGLVFSMAGLTSAQNTNTNTDTNTNSNTNTNRGNTNTNRNTNRNTNTNTNRGNTNNNNDNTSRGNTNNNDSSGMTGMPVSNNNNGRATARMGGTLTAMDTKFAMDAAYSNNAEIAAGRMALTKSSNAEVQRFAQMMIDHHTQANADLARMNPGVTLPTGLHPHHQAVADGYARLSGMDFDMAYIKGQLGDHAMTLDMLDMYRGDGNHRELKDYAKKAQPIVKQHLSMVRAMDTRMATGMTTPNARVDQ